MGRLFWKFFIFIWLLQVVGMFGIGFSFWLRDRAHIAQELQFEQGPPPPPPQDHGRPPAGPPPKDMPGPGLPRMHRLHLLPPVEAIVINILVGLLSAGLLAWYFSKPIRHLRTAFDAAASGKLATRIGASMGNRSDELADLGHDFDRMAEQLQALIESQQHLLHDVSHELRSPLARLQAAIDLARQTPEKLEATMDRIELESTRIDALVGELLTLSRLEAGVMGDLQDEIHMDELLADIVEDARFEAGMQGRSVEFSGDCSVAVRGRAELLGRAIENVVRNAIKHTPPASGIRIVTEVQNNVLVIAIQDNGSGVPTDELEHIFEPFFRSRTSNGTSGHGLGLAIAKRAVEAHRGTITAHNRPAGGLNVEIRVPVSRHLA